MRSVSTGSSRRNELQQDVKKSPRIWAGALSKDRTGCGLNRRADSASELLFQDNSNFSKAKSRCPGAVLRLLQSNLTRRPATSGRIAEQLSCFPHFLSPLCMQSTTPASRATIEPSCEIERPGSEKAVTNVRHFQEGTARWCPLDGHD